MKILLLQKCGPGNQLFQYAAGLFFAKKYGASLEIIREPDHIAAYFGRPCHLYFRISVSPHRYANSQAGTA